MTEVVTKRLFIGGLSNEVSREDLIERFSRFGKVDNIKLTNRTDDIGIHVKSFAHLDLEGEQAKLKKCFDTYQNTKWKGSVLKLQYAKENFLDKLQKEREEEDIPQKSDSPAKTQKPPDISDIKGPAVPGTPLPGKIDWVVGKYGRVLPIMKLKKSYKLKMIKHDPSKLCHAAKVFKDDSFDSAADTSCEKLTWEIDAPDSEITKKRKGEFPASQSVKKVKDSNSVHLASANMSFNNSDHLKSRINKIAKKEDGFEVVKLDYGKTTTCPKAANKSNIFDSDIESDAETNTVSIEPKKSQPKTVTAGLMATQKNVLPNKTTATRQNIKEANKTIIGSDIESDGGTKAALVEPKKNQPKSCTNTKNVFCGQNKIMPMSTAESTKNKSGLKNIPEFRGLKMLSIESGDDSDDSKVPSKEKSSILVKSDSSPQSNELASPVIVSKNALGKKSPKIALKKKDKANHDFDIPEEASSAKSPKTESSILDSLSHSKILSETTVNISDFNVSLLDQDDGNESVSSADTDEIIARHKKRCNLSQSSIEHSGGKFKKSPPSSLRTKSAPPQSLNSSLSENSFYTSEYSVETLGLSDYSLPNVTIDDTLDDSDLDSNDFELVAKKLEQRATLSSTPAIDTSDETQTEKSPQKVSRVSESVSNDAKKAKKLTKSGGVNKLSTDQSPKVKLSKASINTHESVPEDDRNATKLTEKSGAGDELSTDQPQKDKKTTGNEKRLKALRETSKLKQQQRMLIQKALQNVDSKDYGSSNRKVFASDSEEEPADDALETVRENSVPKAQKDSMKDTLTLFESSSDSDSDYEEMFKSKPHFEGKKGEQLMKMERKFGDSRFKLDAKFVDSDSEEDVEMNNIDNNISKDNILEEEKAASLKVLENIIGKSNLDRFSQKLKRNTKHIIDMNTVRFDPTKLVAQKEVKTEIEKVSPSKLVSDDRAAKEKAPSEENILKNRDNEEKIKKTVSESTKADKRLANTKSVKNDKKDTKSQNPAVDDKTDLEPMDTFENSGKSRVQMDKSLVNLFKIDKDVEKGKDKSQAFSLLDQFDQNDSGSDNSSDENDMDITENKDTKSKNVLSGLFKNTKPLAIEAKKNLKVSAPEISEKEIIMQDPIDETDEDISEAENLPEPDDAEVKTLDDETDKELLSAGRIDVRYTKDCWLKRWEEIRPTLVKLFKRKHKEALKSKRVHTEMKRKKEFLKNAKNKNWRNGKR